MKRNRINWKMLVVGSLVAVAAVCAAVAILFRYCTTIVEERLIKTSSDNLEQTYSTVTEEFDIITIARWRYLEQIAEYLELAAPDNIEKIRNRVHELQGEYGFTEFFLLNEDGRYRTMDGETGFLSLGDEQFWLTEAGEKIISDGNFPGRSNMFFYAVPTERNTVDDFTYCAVGFAFDKNMLSETLAPSVYNGKSDAYLVHANGRVAVTLGNVRYQIINFFYTLHEIGVSDEVLESVKEGLEKERTDTIIIGIRGENYYFNYQPTTSSEWLLVSLTPTAEADRSINEIHHMVLRILGITFSMVLTVWAIISFYWLWREWRDKNSMLAERELVFDVMGKQKDEIFLLYDEIRDRMLYISPNADRLLGFTPEEAYQKHDILVECVEDGAWSNRNALKSLKQGFTLKRECRLRNRRTDESAPYALELYRPMGKDANLLVCSLTNVARERRVRQEITEAMKSARAANEAKSTFLSSMSHDIRTPMNAIIGFTTLLDRDAGDPESVHRYTEKIRTSGTHLLGLINDILDMSKIEAGKTTLNLEPTNLDEIAEQMRDLIRPLAEAKHQTFLLKTDIPADESVMADKLRLVQILQNLLSNAVKYTQDGGRIELEIGHVAEKKKGSFSEYRFTVQDNGMGMSEEYLKSIFLPFTRETNTMVNTIQGTGLGMAITKNLVDLMGGTIDVKSRLHEGSTFTVVLGFRTIGREELREEVPEESDFSLKGLRILAAEDNQLNAEILEELLKMEEASCTITGNGREVLETFEAAAPGAYDLILMDVQMPVMNGYDAARAIRRSEKNPEGAVIPILAMTANAFTEDVQAALAAGMNAHLAKPVDMAALKNTVRKIMTSEEDGQEMSGQK